MTLPIFAPVTADTTRVTADSTVVRPLARVSGRLLSLFPPAWSSTGKVPVRDALFGGCAQVLAWADAVTGYTRLQTRLSTATGIWLDLAAYDFFGLRFQRRRGESDTSFSARIRDELIRPRSTRAALARVVTDRTGIAPDIFEQFNPGDCGAYGVGTFAYGGLIAIQPVLSGYAAPLGGYGVGAHSYGQPFGGGTTGGGAGAYGSLSLPNQLFINVHRPMPAYGDLGVCGGYGIGPFAYGGGRDGVPALSGYAGPLSGYGVGAGSYGLPAPPYTAFTGAGFYPTAAQQESIVDDEIFSVISQTAAAGVVAWTRIQGP